LITSKEDILDKWQEVLQYNEEALEVSCTSGIYDRKCFSKLL